MKIMSGGQTGVDRAGLDAALQLGLSTGGWCPLGRIAEDGVISSRYLLNETPSSDYAERTEWNVRDSDGSIIIHWGKIENGTKFTIDCCHKHNKQFMEVDLSKSVSPLEISKKIQVMGWTRINIAGPRESLAPGKVYSEANSFLSNLFSQLL